MTRIPRYVLVALTFVPAAAAGPAAQAPSPSAASSASADAPNFSGTWTLDRLLSDDPAQANFEAVPRQDQAANRRRGSFSGFGARGGFGGSSGTHADAGAAMTPDERARLSALTNELKTASATLTIAHHDPIFTVTDARGAVLAFDTTSARANRTLGGVAITTTAHWQDGRVVAEFEIGGRRTLVYTYALLPNTRQLVLRVRPQFSDVPGADAVELKLVYSSKPST